MNVHTIGTGGNGRSGKTARNGETLFRASRTSFLPVLERCPKTDRRITPIGGRLQSLSLELNERTLLRYDRLKAAGPLITQLFWNSLSVSRLLPASELRIELRTDL